METTDLDFGNLEILATALEDAGVRSVSIDPGDLNLPGVLIQVTGIGQDLLAGCTIKTNLLLLVDDVKPKQTAQQLQDLYNLVVPVVRGYGGPTDDSVMGKWVLPGQPTPLPGISVPLDLLTTSEETP